MTTQQSTWKANLNSGIILGLIFAIYNLVFYYLDIYFKPYKSFVWMPIIIVLLFLFMKQFRDNHRNGMVSYGQALGAGVVISIYYALIAGIVVFVLFNVIDEGMVAKTLANIEGTMVERGVPDAALGQSMKMYEKVMTAALIPLWQVVNSIFGGTIVSLILALFVKKEGNPLLDQ